MCESPGTEARWRQLQRGGGTDSLGSEPNWVTLRSAEPSGGGAGVVKHTDSSLKGQEEASLTNTHPSPQSLSILITD